MWMRAQPDHQDAGEGVGEECEAFLRGEWAEYRRARGEDVPRWAWLNRVAHAPEQALRLMSPPGAISDRHVDGWTEFRFSVADALVKRADERGMAIAELQASVLVPIELALFARDDSRLPADAVLLVRILAALRRPSVESGD